MNSTLAKDSVEERINKTINQQRLMSPTNYNIKPQVAFDTTGRVAISAFFFIMGILLMIKLLHGT